MTPDDRRYTKTHEWVKIDQGFAVIGITDHAQSELGDITYVEPPKQGSVLEQGDRAAEVESVKAVGEVFAPVAGTVAEINESLEAAPEIINKSSYEDGWIFKMSNFNLSQFESLMDAVAYNVFLEA